MGGHGAISLYLRTTKYRSASAFAPVLHPSIAPWGIKAFERYMSGGVEEGRAYDSTVLVEKSKGRSMNILIDVVSSSSSSSSYYLIE